MSRTPSYKPLRGRLPTDPDAIASIPRPIPLSPPDTELLQDQYIRPHDDSISPPDHNQLAHEVPVSRMRRLGVPSVAYTNAGLTIKDARSPQRQSKWLIVVCPPKSLNKEPPILGHTLASAPAGRFSSGILIPLFPTASLYGQLTAIAREFNMPSTTGLCIYLQLQDNSSPTFNPRISDETWQILWASYFSDDKPPSQVSSHGLPVCGRIEFDIDLRRAKWYNAWMGFAVRDSEGISREPSIVPSHWRGESRTSFFHPEVNLNTDEPPQEAPFSLVRRPGPRPLILETRDSLHRRSSSRTSIRNVFHDLADHENALPAPQAFVPNTLSPMVQELEETQSNKNEELNNIVKKWRQSSIIASSAPPDKGVSILPSLDSAHVPSILDVELKLDLNDYSWSISSAGPPLETPASPAWPERLPSIHLADRMQASRCNTPTNCTSWGPPSEDEYIPDSQSSCLPSPDLGWRMLDFVPLTPSTCTTFRHGDLPSPVFSRPSSRNSSVDIGIRATGSAPMTPSACTTWGPDDQLSPMLSVHSFENFSVDIATRRKGSAPVTPSIITSWGPADTPILTPYSLTNILSPDIGEREFDEFEDVIVRDHNSCWPHIWPHTQSSALNGGLQVPWLHVWPYVRQSSVQSVKLSLEQYPDLMGLYFSHLPNDKLALHNHALSYPSLQIYSPVYPYNLMDIYPGTPASGKIVNSASTSFRFVKFSLENYPDLMDLYSSQLPYDELTRRDHVSSYPFLQIYSPVYPYNLMEIYPRGSASGKVSDGVAPPFQSVELSLEQYPDLMDLYSSRLPSDKLALHNHAPSYPSLQIYSPVYPYNLMEIYPGASASGKTVNSATTSFQSVELSLEQYPGLMGLYPSQLPNDKLTLHNHSSPYPFLQIYSPAYPYNLMEIYPGTHATPSATGKIMMGEELTPSFSYPFLRIYSSVYPFNLLNLYPEIPREIFDEALGKRLDPVYRMNASIESDYPFFDIYPSIHSRISKNKPANALFSSVDPHGERLTLEARYPKFDIYPAVYPFCLEAIYPEIAANLDSVFEGERVAISCDEYPLFNLYPAVYPFNLMDIYHRNSALLSTSVSGLENGTTVSLYPSDCPYPSFNIYPAVYPLHLADIYPPKVADISLSSEDIDEVLDLNMSYTAGYPYSLDNIYARKPASEDSNVELSTDVSLKLQYPHLDTCRVAYPCSLMALYPPVLGTTLVEHPSFEMSGLKFQSSSCDTEVSGNIALVCPSASTYPFFNIYPRVYPYSLDSIYPPLHFETQLYVEERSTLSAPAFYPNFDIYAAVYPFNLENVYPPVLSFEENLESRPQQATKHAVDYGIYPHMTIYSSGYPWNLQYIYQLNSTLENDELGSQDLPPVDENVTISKNNATYPTFDIYPAQYPFFTIYPSTSSTTCTDSQPLVQPIEYLKENPVYRYPFIVIYPSIYPHVTLYPQLQPGSPSISTSLPRATSKRLSNHGIGRRPVRTASEHSTPPPIPVKPRILQRSISLSKPNSLKPAKQRRTHRELYMAVFDEVQRVLAEPVSEVENRGTSQKPNPPSLRPKPAVASRYVLSPTSDRERRISISRIESPEKKFTQSSGSSPSQPRRMQTTSTFNGHVSASIHNRVQSMHLHSSKPKEEELDTGLNRSKSLSDRTRSSVLDRAKIFSAAGIVHPDGFCNAVCAHTLLDKVPPLIPSKPLATFGRPKPSYI